MKCNEVLDRISSLSSLEKVYRFILETDNGVNFPKSALRELLKKTTEELNRLLELYNNMELDDSYDQNTGEIHPSYKQ